MSTTRVQSVAVLWQMWSRKNSVTSLSSRAFSTSLMNPSTSILMSPSPMSLDCPNLWTSGSVQPDCSSIQKYTCKHVAQILNGKAIAEEIRSGIALEVKRMKESIGQVPGLAVILVGQRRESQTYVRNKKIGSEEVGIKFMLTTLSDNCTENEVCNALQSYNENPSVHGTILQLPLPRHLDEGKILGLLTLEKDVDGFHPVNIGNLAMLGREPLFIPCTAKGCIELLLRSGIEIMGKKAVVIGKSNVVGLPTSLLLQRHHATVTIIHPHTKNPDKIAREADILITAAGVPNLVCRSWLKPGAIVVDVGTTPVEDPKCEHGYRLIGDVCFEEASKVASAITPVPGGVGPMTVAMLLYNTLQSAKLSFKFT
ncbi:bifunctional 1, mitochondrial [Olea europaea subsp. europaea]|uniref:Bifunctional 1, mitochondrial n=1 Tax=Olea europaea subsp. europaea TaxID=158383 RepID=A0A8S0VDX8_OLEEU|nr:bifunctional 1, mitochondrial [Olea europaea subsp. europaea]